MNGARYFVATAEKLFEAEGIKVQPVQFNAGPPFFSAFQSGSIDVGFMGFPPASVAIAQGVPVKVIALENNAPDSEALVARADSGISGLEDLKGKKVGFQRGTSGHYALFTALDKEGLSPNDVELVELDATNVIPAFRRGEIDAAWFWEPWQGLLREAGGKQIATDGDIGVKIGIVWLAHSQWLKENPEVAQRLLRAIDKATGPIRERPEEAAAALAGALNVEEDLALTVLTKEAEWPTMAEQWDPAYPLSMNPSVLDDNKGLMGAFSDLAQFQEQVRAIDAKPEFRPAIETAPLEKYVGTGKGSE